MKTSNFKRVLVWELPVRIFHWLNVVALIVLVLSGFLIANPPVLMSSQEATNMHYFGIVRFSHFVAAYLFVAIMVVRIYWAFVGNRFARWRAFWPFRDEFWSNFWHVMKVDVMLQNEKVEDVRKISIGHNSMAKISYIAMFFIALVMVFTGFGLYSDMSTWWFPKMFDWVVPAMGGDYLARTIHHICMWFFILFSMIHVYLVLYHDWLEGRGEVSSMVGGYKFVREDRIKAEDKVKEIDPH